MALHASDPSAFNDPFEIRLAFDQEAHDYFCSTSSQLASWIGSPTENSPDIGEMITKRFREDVSKKFRVVCLSQTAQNVLMWGHYTKSHRGLVIGIDPTVEGFCYGAKEGGFKMTYPKDGMRVKLPLAYYRGISVERWDAKGNVVNSPNELVEYGSGLQIEFSQYMALKTDALLTVLQTKAPDWAYEEEVRFIYEMPNHADQLQVTGSHQFVSLPRSALRQIIFGFHASFDLVREAVELFKTGALGSPTLFYATCHPYQYEVQSTEADADYLLNYYRDIKPTLR
jgi:hypothetical protein